MPPSVHDLRAPVATPGDGIVSRVIFEDDQVRVVHFTFDQGQELTDHTAAMPAIIEIIDGDARITLAGDEVDASPGTWVHLPAGLVHAILARTRVTMLLTLLRGGR